MSCMGSDALKTCSPSEVNSIVLRTKHNTRNDEHCYAASLSYFLISLLCHISYNVVGSVRCTTSCLRVLHSPILITIPSGTAQLIYYIIEEVTYLTLTTYDAST